MFQYYMKTITDKVFDYSVIPLFALTKVVQCCRETNFHIDAADTTDSTAHKHHYSNFVMWCDYMPTGSCSFLKRSRILGEKILDILLGNRSAANTPRNCRFLKESALINLFNCWFSQTKCSLILQSRRYYQALPMLSR